MAVHGRGSVLIKFSNLILIKCVAHEVTRRKRGRLNLYSMDRAAADRAYLWEFPLAYGLRSQRSNVFENLIAK
jgi:hypothetical protein